MHPHREDEQDAKKKEEQDERERKEAEKQEKQDEKEHEKAVKERVAKMREERESKETKEEKHARELRESKETKEERNARELREEQEARDELGPDSPFKPPTFKNVKEATDLVTEAHEIFVDILNRAGGAGAPGGGNPVHEKIRVWLEHYAEKQAPVTRGGKEVKPAPKPVEIQAK